MLTCPICGARITDWTRVCPACRAYLVGGSGARPRGGRRSRMGGIVIGIVVAVALLVGIDWWIMFRSHPPGPSWRTHSKANLGQLALALHHYYDEHSSFPLAEKHLDTGAAAHGWQTHILPYIDQSAAYNAMNFDRAWDDPANAPPVRTRIDVYLNPKLSDTHDARGYPRIHYAGNVHVLGRVPALTFSGITDGMANTILVGEVSEGLRAWGDPRNLRDPGLGLHRGPATFGSVWNDDSVQFAAADGSVRVIAWDTAPHILRALATPDGGETATFP